MIYKNQMNRRRLALVLKILNFCKSEWHFQLSFTSLYAVCFRRVSNVQLGVGQAWFFNLLLDHLFLAFWFVFFIYFQFPCYKKKRRKRKKKKPYGNFRDLFGNHFVYLDENISTLNYLSLLDGYTLIVTKASITYDHRNCFYWTGQAVIVNLICL